MGLSTAIVTGASSGLGAEFARQLDGRQEVEEIWLVARRGENLEKLALSLRKPAKILVADLRTPQGLGKLRQYLEDSRPAVTWLINNAGFGKFGKFVKQSTDDNLGMIDLNIRALTAISQMVLPYCVPPSHVVQVASAAGFQPVPNMAVYAATKAYVIHFSDALQAELAGAGISVTSVCPGPVRTEFFSIASPASPPRRMRFAEAQAIVSRAIRDASRGRLRSFPHLGYWVLSYASRLAPRHLLLGVLAPRRTDSLLGLQSETSFNPTQNGGLPK